MLAQSRLRDFITISLDHSDNVVGINLGVSSEMACQGAKVAVDELRDFKTKVYVNPINTGTM